MTNADFLSLTPLIVMALTAVAIILLISFRRSHAATANLTGLGLVAALATIPVSISAGERTLEPLLRFDGMVWFYFGLLLLATITVLFLTYSYMERYRGNREEFYLLLVLSTLGGMVLVCSNHFVSLFLGLEMLTISLYTLIAYPYRQERPLEAGVKYLILAAVSSAMLLFGMALVYASTGTMRLDLLTGYMRDGFQSEMPLILPGTVLLLAGLGFKVAVVPFHMWIPDVYEGAPIPSAAFLATVSKGAVIGLLIRLLSDLEGTSPQPGLFAVLAIVAVASMLIGNLLALMQNNVKRILAYSSIAHMGYVFVAFLVGGAMGSRAATFYVVTYFVTILGAFAVLSALSGPEEEFASLDDYQALFQRKPAVAVVFTAMLLSLAGIPLTAGFIGKFYIVAAGVSTAHWILIGALIVSSSIGVYYYLRLVRIMFAFKPSQVRLPAVLPASGVFALTILTAVLIWLGVYPTTVLQIVQRAVGGTF